MLKKKYQVFVSSTFDDLKEERSQVYESILSMGHIPVGMEYFGSRSKTSVAVIKGFLDQCDFQLTIIGSRYGSLIQETQVSYTEMEYDYANDIRIPQLGFLQRSNGKYVNQDDSEINIQRLKTFRDKVVNSRQCAFWEKGSDLVSEIQRALPIEIAENDRPGWIRADNLSISSLPTSEYSKISDELSGVKAAIDRYRKNVVESNRKRFEMNCLPTPSMNGMWQCLEKNTTMELFEYAGAVISYFVTGTHEHWLHGMWSPENKEIQTQIWRRERMVGVGGQKRITIMFGRMFDIEEAMFHTEIFASDGKADLEHNYSEHLTWKRLSPTSA